LLELLLGEEHNVSSRLSFAAALDEQGYRDASEYVQKRTLEQISTMAELGEARAHLLSREPKIDLLVANQLKKCNTDAERLSVVQRALALAPHSPLGQRLLLILLENLGDLAQLVRLADAIRRDPMADAGLLSLSAAAVGRMGQKRESRRNFSELFERSPEDPWVLAFAGDALQNSGWYDDAIVAYESLGERVPGDSSSLLRLGLVQSAAGRIDIATRLIERAAQTGGREDNERLYDLASVLKAKILLDAALDCKVASTCTELAHRLREAALPEAYAIALVQTKGTAEDAIAIASYRAKEKTPTPPALAAPDLGTFGFYLDSDTEELRLSISRKLLCGLGRELPVTISVIRPGSATSAATQTTVRKTFAANTSELTVMLGGESFQ
jgi:tetratricopeptide (TPR) repeat protein